MENNVAIIQDLFRKTKVSIDNLNTKFRYPENIHARRTHRRNLHGEKLRHRRNRRRLPPAMRGSRIRHVLPLDNVRTDQQRVDILDGSRA